MSILLVVDFIKYIIGKEGSEYLGDSKENKILASVSTSSMYY